MRRLGEEAVNVVAKGELHSKRHPAGAAADATRQVNEQRVIGINDDALLTQLRRQPQTSDGVADGRGGIDHAATGIMPR